MSGITVEIEREYGPFPDRVHGVSFDGQQVWFASDKGLRAFDSETGQPTRALDVPCDAGVAFDGTHLYQLSAGEIHKVDPHTGRILATIAAPSPGCCSGLAWAEGSLWVGGGPGRHIHEVDPKTGKVLRTVRSDRFVTGVSFSEGELWHATHLNEEHDRSQLRRVDRHTGEVLECLELPAGVGCTGLEADGNGKFYCGGGSTGKVRVVKRPQPAARAHAK